METKVQVKNEPQEPSEAETQKKKHAEDNSESPPAKRECLSIVKPKNPPPETTILPPPPPPLQLFNMFFELFYDGPYDLTLSNRSWGIHRVPPPNRAIVLSEITFALFNISNTTMSPAYKKQVILTDHLKFKAFVLDKLVVEKTLDMENTQEDFEQSFMEVANMTVCKGGLNIEDDQDILLRYGYKDFYSNRWRHESCTIIVEKEEVCRPCSYLDKYYQEWLKYNLKDKK